MAAWLKAEKDEGRAEGPVCRALQVGWFKRLSCSTGGTPDNSLLVSFRRRADAPSWRGPSGKLDHDTGASCHLHEKTPRGPLWPSRPCSQEENQCRERVPEAILNTAPAKPGPALPLTWTDPNPGPPIHARLTSRKVRVGAPPLTPLADARTKGRAQKTVTLTRASIFLAFPVLARLSAGSANRVVGGSRPNGSPRATASSEGAPRPAR